MLSLASVMRFDAVVGEGDPAAVRRGDLQDLPVARSARIGRRPGQRDRIAEPIADRLQRRVLAEDVDRAILQRQIPAGAVPHNPRFVEGRRRRGVLEHAHRSTRSRDWSARSEFVCRPAGSDRPPDTDSPTTGTSHRVRHPDPERPRPAVAESGRCGDASSGITS